MGAVSTRPGRWLLSGTNIIYTDGSVGTSASKITKVWATDLEVTNAIAGSVTGAAGSVTNATLTTALTIDTGTVSIHGDAMNNSELTLGAGVSSVSGANTGDSSGHSALATIANPTFTGTGLISGNNLNAAYTLLTLTNSHETSGTEVSQTADLVMKMTGSINEFIYDTYQAAKISAYKVSDWYAADATDIDSGLKFWVTNDNTPALALTIANTGIATFAQTISGSITGNAATVSTITGLAPDTATTQATQPNITSLGELSNLIVAGSLTVETNMTCEGFAKFTRIITTYIDAPAAGDIEFTLGDDAGVSFLYFYNYSANLAGSIDSLGNAIFTSEVLSNGLTVEGIAAFSDEVRIGYDAVTLAPKATISYTGGDLVISNGVISPTLTELAAPEGTAVLSTGEVGGTKYLREDGDGTCSWQAVSAGETKVYGEMYGSAITIDIVTLNVWVEVNSMLAGESTEVTIANSDITITTAGRYEVIATASITVASATQTAEMAFSVNDNIIAKSIQNSPTLASGLKNNMMCSAILNLSVSDVLKLEMRNIVGTADIVATYVNIFANKIGD